MPALPPVPGAIRVRHLFTVNASIPVGFGYHLTYTGGPPAGSDMSTLASGIESHWASAVQGDMPTDVTLTEVTATDISSASGAVGTWSGSDPGGTSGTIVSAGACFVLNHQISRRYRGGKPRTYVPGVLLTDMTDTNQISSGRQASLLSSWEAFVSGVLGITGMSITLQNIASVSYFSGFTTVLNPVTGRTRDVPKLRVDGPVIDVIRSTTVAAKLGSQRRRLNL